MKIDRRAFLSLGLGAAAGTAITPLPWKLIDDSSIWTQTWPWTPVPPVGKVSHVNSVCTLCPGGCGITVRKSGDRAIKIEGRGDHPVNNGGICMLGLSGLQLLYGPTRIQTPLKRIGKRGENIFKPISWAQAQTFLKETLSNLRNEKKSHELACILGNNDDSCTNLFGRFCQAFGTSNVFQMPSAQDISSEGLKRMQGDTGPIAYDLENADYILSFGAGLIDGWGAPVNMFYAHGKRKSALKQSNVRFVQIDSRLSNTAAKADTWFAVTPGTEAILALAMAQFILHEHRYNHDFTRRYTQGLDAFKAMVDKQYTPRKASTITGLDEEIIRFLAKDFSQAKRPVAVFGRGSLENAGSVQEFMAVHALNALMGNIYEKGGSWAKPNMPVRDWKPAELDDIAIEGLNQKSIDPDAKDISNRPHRLIEQICKAKQSPVSCLMVYGANPVYQLSNHKSVQEALNKIPSIVSFSSFMDETAIQADLILPDHLYLEKYGETMTPPGMQKPIVSLCKPVVDPIFETRNTGDVIIDLAKKMGGAVANAFPWPDYLTCLKQRLGQHWKELENKGFVENSSYKPVKRFSTSSRKFEFTSTQKQSFEFNPITIDGELKKYPLIMVPCDSIRLVADGAPTPPFMIKSLDDTVLKGNDILVEINSKTAKSLGLRHNDIASLSTPHGNGRVRVNVSDGIMPDVVAIPRGLGHTAYDDYLSGKGVNYMSLIGPVEDSMTGQDVAWGIRARLSKA
ncbi:MAG: Molybdopterin oxidoreductase, Fe4S4 [Candidatus Magnetoglobus multicellularis str. Araruama]|uniref:Molybdopterin oxidoreductase, Fe4S4 n=1 Tax=Candidatus Magnetoglobus multicellularis str. Araruama TaxID=890399 RepID=A0A1V1PEJ5_9BACT|nr:MAG: Molybdopterin oxidoreductase, Fe4S4 [Candidatus Magnetoglobus multicellularis str. Araruama]